MSNPIDEKIKILTKEISEIKERSKTLDSKNIFSKKILANDFSRVKEIRLELEKLTKKLKKNNMALGIVK